MSIIYARKKQKFISSAVLKLQYNLIAADYKHHRNIQSDMPRLLYINLRYLVVIYLAYSKGEGGKEGAARGAGD